MYKGGEMVRGKFVVAHTIFSFFHFSIMGQEMVIGQLRAGVHRVIHCTESAKIFTVLVKSGLSPIASQCIWETGFHSAG